MTSFVDVHVHPPLPEFFDGPFAPFVDGLRRAFSRDLEPESIDEVADHYRRLDGKAVLLAWDAETATRRRPLTNARVAELAVSHPDVFVGFGSVDPHKGAAAVAGVHEAARLGLRGLKFHPPAQRFAPDDRRVYSVWEVAAEHRLPVLIHTGSTALGAGLPGGGGVELAYGDPMLVDRVAAHFPDLPIILAHPSWPWQDQALAVARHKPNVYLELSGWSPRLFSPALVEAISGPLADRTLFGTDYPFITPERWLDDFAELGVDDDVTRLILYDNAAELLGLEG